ncbi:hypothetical protein BGZ59_009273 [Podila verticillata]|nr:hypothetical protein BGZ59_009273 [Podila verticillata]
MSDSVLNDNKLLLIDPKVHSLQAAPVVLKEISVPAPGLGPHYVGEYGNDLWASLQNSYAVLRISHVNPCDYNIYQGVPRPVFVANTRSARIDPKTGSTTQYMVPQEIGQTPVGMISGPNGVWFTLLGNATSGTGTVGFIDAHNNITYHKLQSILGQDAALLHLAFDLNVAKNHVLWLLSSSTNYSNALNSIIKITFDAKWQSILKEEVKALPTQYSEAHRILITPHNIFATELASFKLLTAMSTTSQNSRRDERASTLSKALKTNSTPTTLDLQNKSIVDEGAQVLAEELKTNSTLTTLNLKTNLIGSNVGQALTEALKTNSTLTTLSVENNSIRDNGAQALSEVLKTNSTLITFELGYLDDVIPDLIAFRHHVFSEAQFVSNSDRCEDRGCRDQVLN